MQSNNGDVELSVTLDIKGIKSDAKKIKEEIEKEVSKTSVSFESTKNTSDKLKTEKEIDKLNEKRLDLTSKIADAESEGNIKVLEALQQQRSEIDKQITQLKKLGEEPTVDLIDVDEESKKLDELYNERVKLSAKIASVEYQGSEYQGSENLIDLLQQRIELNKQIQQLEKDIATKNYIGQYIGEDKEKLASLTEESTRFSESITDSLDPDTFNEFVEKAEESKDVVQEIDEKVEDLNDTVENTVANASRTFEDFIDDFSDISHRIGELQAQSEYSEDANVKISLDSDKAELMNELTKLIEEFKEEIGGEFSEATATALKNVINNAYHEAYEDQQQILECKKQQVQEEEKLNSEQKETEATAEIYVEAIQDARLAARGLADDLAVFEEGKQYSSPFKDLQKDYSETLKSLQETEARLREMELLGEDISDSEFFEQLQTDAEEYKTNLEEINLELDEMRSSGEAYTDGVNEEEVAAVQQQYDTLLNKLSLMQAETKRTAGSFSEMNHIAQLLPGSLGTSFGKITRASQSLAKMSSESFEGLGNKLASVGNELKGLATGAMSAAGAVASAVAIIGGSVVIRITQAIKEAKTGLAQLTKILNRGLQIALRGISGSVGFLWNTFLKLGKLIGGSLVQGVRSLISRLMSLKGVIMENINLMAKWHKGNNAVNKAMSDLTSSLAYLKASLASAFVPILTTIEPILDSLINKLAEVITMIGMFIAKITGATTFQKAIRKQKDYAKSLKGVGGAAKEASESLADYDKLQVIQSKSGGGAGVDFKEVGLEAVDLSNLLDDLVAKAYEWGHTLGTNLKNFLDNIPWATIQENVNKAAKAIANFINGFVEVEGLAKSVGHTIGEAINTLIGFVNTFLTETHWDSIGKFIGDALMEAIRTIHWDELGQMFANLLNATFELVHNFTEVFDGKEFGEKLSEMLTNFTQNLNWEEIQAAVTGVVEDLVGILNGLVTPETFTEVGTTLGKTIQTIFMGIGTAIDTAEWEQWSESLKTGITNMFSEIKFDEAGQSVSNLTKGLLTLIEGAVDGLLSTGADGKDIGDKLVEFIENIDWAGISTKAVSISQKLSEGLEKVFEELENSDAYDQIINAIVDFLNEKKNWERLFKRFKNSIIRDVVIEMVWGQTKELFQGAIDSFKMAFEGIENGDELSEIGANILRGIAAGWLGWFDIFTEPIREIFEGIVNGFADIFGIHSPATTMEPTGENIILGIVEGFKLVDFATKMQEWWNANVVPWFSLEKWSEIADNVKLALSQKWEEIKVDATDKWELIKTSISEKWELIKTTVGEAIELLKTTLSEKWNDIKEEAIETFEALKDGLKEPINGILSMIEKFINAVVSGLNGLIGKLNTVKIDVPDWAKKIPGVGSLSFNVPTLNEVKIPRLAQGAVIPPNKEFLAMLGDQKSGTNIEAPLNTMMDAFRQVLTEFEGVSGSKEPIILQLSGKTVAQVVWDEERKKYKQTSSYQY